LETAGLSDKNTIAKDLNAEGKQAGRKTFYRGVFCFAFKSVMKK